MLAVIVKIASLYSRTPCGKRPFSTYDFEMCGIFVATNDAISAHRAMIDRCLERRGTEKAVWHVTECGNIVAHCLLPVRGDTPVLQPIETRKGLLVFSGELWDVEGGKSDTIALCERIERLGLRATMKASQGMWALVLVDPRRKEIAFCTDVFGEQPLHYAIVGTDLAVASEIKTLVAAGFPLTAISHVRPGILYEFDGSNLITAPFAAPHSSNRWKTFNTEVLRNRIARAVSNHIESVDMQQVGILLSGGIDSTIIAWHASQLGVRKAWTIAVDRNASDAIAAGQVAERFGLDWECICGEPLPIEFGVVAAEVVNRSVLEESCLHIVLARHLSERGVRVVLTGCGADELFIGYAHLLRRLPKHLLQQRFLTEYFKLDLRAMNKVYGGFAVEIRNPFLHPAVVSYALQLDSGVLVGPKTILKWPLREAYADVLGQQRVLPKRIARQTMGAQAWFSDRYPDGAKVFHPLWKVVLSDSKQTIRLLSEIDR